MATVAPYFDLDYDVDTESNETATRAKLQDCILLIEDNEEAMWLVRHALQDYGNGRYRLEWANSLSQGLDYLAKGGIDVVVLDLGLPESTGAASYAWVRELAPKTPVVVLTGDAREETEFAVTASGVEGYLMKCQVTGALLLQAIRAALYANKRRQEQRSMVSKLLRPRL